MSRSGARYEQERRQDADSAPRRSMAVTVVGAVVLAVVAVLVGFALGRSSDDGSDVASGNATTTTEAGDDEPATGDGDDVEPSRESDGDDEGDDDGGTTGPGDDEPVSVAPPTLLDVAGLEGPALEMATAINRAAGLEYHARYEGDVVGEEGATTQLTVELWRRLPRARRDTTISGQRELRTREFRLPDGIFGCLEVPPELDYSCYPAETGTVDPSDPVFGAVDPRAGLVISREGEFEGSRVDCWEVESIDEPTTTLCVDAEGIPVVIDGGDGRLLRTMLDDASDSSTFELPAPVEERG